jgi:hypothetical protein
MDRSDEEPAGYIHAACYKSGARLHRVHVILCMLNCSLRPNYFLTEHCEQILRPKWRELYAARRRQRCAASYLPELPDTFFGWMPVLFRITDEQVLNSAGLDAFVVSALLVLSTCVYG